MKHVLMTIGVLVIIGILLIAFRSGDSRDWAELTLVSVQVTQDGQVTGYFTSRHSNGAGIESTHYVDGVSVGGGRGRSRGLPFIIPTGSETTVFHLNPERVPLSGGFTNSELFARLLMRVGETRLFRVGEAFSLYDFAAGGKHYSCVYRVIAHDEPDEQLIRRP